ncbi:hypothetical protein SprV_0501883500 [Sparganum proliferum]
MVISKAMTTGGGWPLYSGLFNPATYTNRVGSVAQFLPVGSARPSLHLQSKTMPAHHQHRRRITQLSCILTLQFTSHLRVHPPHIHSLPQSSSCHHPPLHFILRPPMLASSSSYFFPSLSSPSTHNPYLFTSYPYIHITPTAAHQILPISSFHMLLLLLPFHGSASSALRLLIRRE